MSVIATVTRCVQVGQDSLRDIHISREFSEKRSIADVLSWARAETGDKRLGICGIQFSEYDGASI